MVSLWTHCTCQNGHFTSTTQLNFSTGDPMFFTRGLCFIHLWVVVCYNLHATVICMPPCLSDGHSLFLCPTALQLKQVMSLVRCLLFGCGLRLVFSLVVSHPTMTTFSKYDLFLVDINPVIWPLIGHHLSFLPDCNMVCVSSKSKRKRKLLRIFGRKRNSVVQVTTCDKLMYYYVNTQMMQHKYKIMKIRDTKIQYCSES